MNRKTWIIIIVISLFLIYQVYLRMKFLSNENMTTVKVKVIGFPGGKNHFDYAIVQYSYKGKTYESVTDKSVLGLYNNGDEMYVAMDTLDPEKIKNIPDTFIAYENFWQEGKIRFYDTFTAYNVKYKSYNGSIKFNIYIGSREYKMQKLTKLKPLRDSMLYIMVNGYPSEGFLKNY